MTYKRIQVKHKAKLRKYGVAKLQEDKHVKYCKRRSIYSIPTEYSPRRPKPSRGKINIK